MSILEANGSIACAECGKKARTEYDQLQAENAKLRELVQSYYAAMLCTLDTGIWPTDPEWLERRMRELGVEP